MIRHYIGVDISKHYFDACFSESGPVLKFPNTTEGIDHFFHTVSQGGLPEETLLGMESTASYHLALALRGQEAHYQVQLLNPLVVKNYARTHLRSVKTDRQDAKLIRFCLLQGAGSPFRETRASLALKTWERERVRSVRLRQQIRMACQELQARQALCALPLPSSMPKLLEMLTRQMKALDRHLATHQPALQHLLQSIPGIGPQTAITLVAEIQDIHHFPTPQHLTAFLGLDPRVCESGTSLRRNGSMTKRGNDFVRTRLYQAASTAVQRPNLFQAFFLKKRAEGKPYRVALGAVMRKMVHVIHAVWTRHTPFQSEPPTKSGAARSGPNGTVFGKNSPARVENDLSIRV
jgi:transposase